MAAVRQQRESGSVDLSASISRRGPMLTGLNRRVTLDGSHDTRVTRLQVSGARSGGISPTYAKRGSGSPISARTRTPLTFTVSTPAAPRVHPDSTSAGRPRAYTNPSPVPSESRHAGVALGVPAALSMGVKEAWQAPNHKSSTSNRMSGSLTTSASPMTITTVGPQGSSLSSTASTTAPASPMGPVLLSPEQLGTVQQTPAVERKLIEGLATDGILHTPPKAVCPPMTTLGPSSIWKPAQVTDSWMPHTPRQTTRVVSPSTPATVIARTPSAPSVWLKAGGLSARPPPSPLPAGTRAVNGHSPSFASNYAIPSWHLEVPTSWATPVRRQRVGDLAEEAAAVGTCQELPKSASGTLLAAVVQKDKRSILNVPLFPGGFKADLPAVGSVDAVALAAELQSCILSLYMEHLLEGGKKVDYAALRSSPEFSSYVAQTFRLAGADLATLSQVQLKVFVLNIYNALVIHATAVLGGFDANIKGSIAEFFTGACYYIGGHVFSLDDLEHGILRGNTAHPTSGNIAFQESDPRLAFALPLDPRVHCALVCGAKSCPPIRIYEEENLEEGLDLAVAAFCDSEVKVTASGVISMSKLFDWYKTDFAASEDEMLVYLLNYIEGPAAEELQSELSRRPQTESNVDGYIIEYSPYDWSRNGLA